MADTPLVPKPPLTEPPVRLCCMQRHYGVQCPDGKVQCALCFDRFDLDEMSIDPVDGMRENVCWWCAYDEGPRRILELMAPAMRATVRNTLTD